MVGVERELIEGVEGGYLEKEIIQMCRTVSSRTKFPVRMNVLYDVYGGDATSNIAQMLSSDSESSSVSGVESESELLPESELSSGSERLARFIWPMMRLVIRLAVVFSSSWERLSPAFARRYGR